MNMSTFLVFGISGVGKTTRCANFCAKHTNFLHIQASKILQQSRNSTSETLRTSPKYKIEENQSILVTKFLEIRNQNLEKSFLIDAHCVIDSDREYIYIPPHVFSGFLPDRFFVLESDPKSIALQRNADPRQRPNRAPDELDEYQTVASNYAKFIASELKKPLKILFAPTDEEFEKAISSNNQGMIGPN
ncbi:adenylate kinase [Methylobacterium sp. RAS18]|nr:adenylate kinase [Methylobacterium sp. RAS18]